MNTRPKLEQIFTAAMERKGVLPVRAKNNKTLQWLEKRGCVVSWVTNHNQYWHPMNFLHAQGYKDGLQQYFTLRGIFTTAGSNDTGFRAARRGFEWVEGGVIIEIECKEKKSKRRYKPRPETLTIWVPRETADRALLFGDVL